MRAFDRDMANGYLAGALGEVTEAKGEAAMLALGRALASAYGSDILKAIQAEACSMWQHETMDSGRIWGGAAGKAHRRHDIATPIDDRLFFAGEAASLDFFSTCHGAHLTGIAAVEAAAKTLGR